MRGVEERCAAVRGRARRLRRRRNGHMLVALVCLMAFPLAELVGRTAAVGMVELPVVDGRLFGAASLFGANVGGYVLVALITAVVVALVTVLYSGRQRSSKGRGDAPKTITDFIDDKNSQGR